MPFDAPGNADSLPNDLKAAWNALIQSTYRGLEGRHGSRFFTLNQDTVDIDFTAAAKWFGQPAEPVFCLGRKIGATLADWGVKGRHRTHNEYCEYRVVMAKDRNDQERPKRVEVTTELREYWTTLAMHDPEYLRDRAAEVLGREVAWEQLYGPGVTHPQSMDPRELRVRFSREVAGNGNHADLSGAGVPSQPVGRLNTENLLFMTHPINGLDDLLYIVMFGAHPWSKKVGDHYERASKETLFRANGVTHLACRNADPAAATTAHDLAFDGRTVAFANPLGVSIQGFASNVFSYRDEPIPARWVRFSRGSGDASGPLNEAGFQRLVFGPGDDQDDADVFLDDIFVSVGNEDARIVGGYQVVEQMEVGPKVVVGKPSSVSAAEYAGADVGDASGDAINCAEAQVCARIRALKEEYDQAQLALPGGTMHRPRAHVREARVRETHALETGS